MITVRLFGVFSDLFKEDVVYITGPREDLHRAPSSTSVLGISFLFL